MDIGSPEIWQWIWLALAFVFGIAEAAVPGTFYMLPFGIGAAAAAALSFFGAPSLIAVIVFVVVSVGALALLAPIRRRLRRSGPTAEFAANRLLGTEAIVTKAIAAGASEAGGVRAESEDWPARSVDGRSIEAGETVEVVRVEGTHLIVTPTPTPTQPSSSASQ